MVNIQIALVNSKEMELKYVCYTLDTYDIILISLLIAGLFAIYNVLSRLLKKNKGGDKA
jgi:hypothetical protein